MANIMDGVGELTRMAIEAGKERDAAIARAVQAEAALAAMRAPCVWRKDDYNWWQLGCGNGELFVKQGEFCPNCGHPIEVQRDQEPAP